MVETVLSSIDLVEPMIVNICHHHLDRKVKTSETMIQFFPHVW